MNVAPKIGKRDLEEELTRIHRDAHRTKTTVLFASGETGEISAEVNGQPTTFRVRPARCEIELREHLANLNDSPTVILVDYDDRLPLDVQGRVASGKVFFVSRKERLARLFGAKGVAPGLQASPLVAELLAQPDVRYGHISGAVIDLDTAWRAWLYAQCGLPASGDLFAELLLKFCAESTSGPSFAQRLSARPPELRAALRDWINQTTGAIGLAAWVDWEAGSGKHAAAMAFILEVAARHLATNGYLLARVDALLERYAHLRQDMTARRFSVLSEWGGLAGPLALRLSAVPGLLEAVLKDADDMLPAAPELDPVVRDSSRLKRGFELGRADLAAALQHGLTTRTSDAFEAAVRAFDRLRQHRLAALQPHLIERTRMVVRLLGYRVSRPDFVAKAKGGPPYEEMVLLAEHFAEQGGFVDLARREARGAASSDALEEAIRLVIDDIDRLGDDDDRRFAQGLATWLMAGRKTDRLVPIDLGIERFAAAFLESKPDRRLLVVLLDGMSWANAVELLEDLDGHHRISPIRWRPKGAAESLAAGALPPMMAALPTVTEVSRSALFAGRLLGPGDRPDTSKDPSRFADHKALNKVGVTAPKLLLKSNVQAGSGNAAGAALALVRSDDRVVAVVLNVIDDLLKTTNAMKVEYVLEKILPLADLVKAAREARRVMLFVSDHGHATATRMSQVGTRGEDGHARYRDLPEDSSPAEFELAIGGEFVRRTKGKGKVAMLYRETDRYCASGEVGEHGGASRAEVVAPAILVADVDLAVQLADEDRADPDLEPVHFARPEWWDLRLSTMRSAVIAAAVTHEPPRMEATGSGNLFPVVKAHAPAPPENSKWRKLLLDAPVFKDLSKEKKKKLETEVIPRVIALAEEDGRLPIEAFARKIGLRKDRVAGVVAVLGEWLHIDGYEVVRIDQAADQVVLDLTLLEDLFRSGT